MRTRPALAIAFSGSPDLLQAALLDYNVSAIHETDPTSWQVFFGTRADRDAAAIGLAQRCPDLSIRALDVPDEDSAARSQASLRAIRIGAIVVAPPWDVPTPAVHGPAPAVPPPVAPARNAPRPVVRRTGSAAPIEAPRTRQPIVIVIQPSLGFGTGHHATTRLCLAALQQIDLRGRTVVDIGTGSGVLAVAADRLGASDVLGLDDDPDAIQAARGNLQLNPGATVVFRTADLRSVEAAPCDVVTANLTGDLLIRAAARLHDLTVPSGHLILCGFTTDEEATVRAGFAGFTLAARAEEDQWVCVTLQRAA